MNTVGKQEFMEMWENIESIFSTNTVAGCKILKIRTVPQLLEAARNENPHFRKTFGSHTRTEIRTRFAKMGINPKTLRPFEIAAKIYPINMN